MIEILRKSQEVYTRLTQKEGEADALLTDLGKREAAVRAREERNTAYENAAAVLQAAEIRRKEADAEFARLEEERVKFENWTKEERQALKNEEARLAPLQDAEKQLAVDRASLYDQQAALEVEKREYKARYIAKIKAHFANTGGAPDPDAIT